MALDLVAKIIEMLPLQSGQSQSGEWTKQELLVETQDPYPKKILFEDFNCKAESNKFSAGDMVKISFNLESKEFKNRYYTTAKVWKIEAAGESSPARQAPAQQPAARPSAQQQPPQPPFQTTFDDEGSDLPF